MTSLKSSLKTQAPSKSQIKSQFPKGNFQWASPKSSLKLWNLWLESQVESQVAD